jgi:hypothetical protein
MRGRPHLSARALALGGVVALLLSSGAEASVCASRQDGETLSLRVLQSDLMVAALKCRTADRYGSFVTTFNDVLINNGAALKKFFRHGYGASGTRALDSFITRLANDSSQRAYVGGPEYCAQTSALFSDVLAVNQADLKKFASARPEADRHGVPTCNANVLAQEAIQLPGGTKN